MFTRTVYEMWYLQYRRLHNRTTATNAMASLVCKGPADVDFLTCPTADPDLYNGRIFHSATDPCKYFMYTKEVQYDTGRPSKKPTANANLYSAVPVQTSFPPAFS